MPSTSKSTTPRIQESDYVLTLSCHDRPGIVYAVSKFLFEKGLNIVESQQFDDHQTGMFFMRVQVEVVDGSAINLEDLRISFKSVATTFEMNWRLLSLAEKQRVLIMVSRAGHCLNDLLFRSANRALNIEIPLVVSNHPDLAGLAASYNIPYRHIPVSPDTKLQAEAQLLELIEDLDIDLVVLARYMQILSTDLCKRLEGQAINIHHSILPSFKGGRPYHQAHDRGVKLVGATAHYVTEDLDEGPIIEQEVARVNHSMSAEEVAMLGRDTESLALARAVRWHTENRVMLNGIRTVVLH
ncbi:MAG: formyltetrahydrofolate deformylase [Acidimicrobiaceae bacterium]|nr:formyltetrahydrofolate deformylase [Acidimicrobiaceae bacterium]